jgi:hypothetical protein
MLNLTPYVRWMRFVMQAIALFCGSVGVYALVCSSLHPHPDAALWAFLMLGTASVVTLAITDVARDI